MGFRGKKMKTMILAAFAALSFGAYAQGSTHVDGYIKKDGTYVQPHTRTNPNSTTTDNYSTKGNYNPYSGKSGTK